MKETRTINLNGMVYHIDYDAYQSLRDYIQDIELRLPMNDRQEIIADIEARIAELFQNALFAKNIQVVNLAIVNNVKVLALGAFGCGVFGNDPNKVANIMATILEVGGYKEYFEEIIFPLNGTMGENVSAFVKVFKKFGFPKQSKIGAILPSTEQHPFRKLFLKRD
jgi:hypothetical protein